MIVKKLGNIIVLAVLGIVVTATFLPIARVSTVIRRDESTINSVYRLVTNNLLDILAGPPREDFLEREISIAERIEEMLSLHLFSVLRSNYPEINLAFQRVESEYREYRSILQQLSRQPRNDWDNLVSSLISRQRILVDSLTKLTDELTVYLDRQEYFYRIIYFFYIGGIVMVALLMVQQNRTIRHQQHHNLEVQELTERIIESQEWERNRIALDLHDTIAQELSTLMLSIETMADGMEGEVSDEYKHVLRKRIKKVTSETKHVLVHVREISYALRPPELQDLGFERAVFNMYNDFAARTGIECRYENAGLEPCPLGDKEKISLYRIIQEGLNNIEKHADASLVDLEIRFAGGWFMVRLRDDGAGFDQKKIGGSGSSHMGLRGIRERVRVCGGSVQIESGKNKGTAITIAVPLKRSSV